MVANSARTSAGSIPSLLISRRTRGSSSSCTSVSSANAVGSNQRERAELRAWGSLWSWPGSAVSSFAGIEVLKREGEGGAFVIIREAQDLMLDLGRELVAKRAG